MDKRATKKDLDKKKKFVTETEEDRRKRGLQKRPAIFEDKKKKWEQKPKHKVDYDER